MPKKGFRSFARPRVDLADVRARASAASSEEALEGAHQVAAASLPVLGETSAPSTPAQWASRADAPHAEFTSGAERWTHGTVIPEGKKRDALRALLRDVHSNSSRGSSASLLKTWESIHRSWHGPDVPVWPLTPEKLAVAAVMKWKKYRSFPNYLSRAKEYHVALAGVWGEDLILAARQATRSVQRGIGPPRQSEPLRLDLISQAPVDDLEEVEAVVEGGPLFSINLIIIAVYFLLRELEASLTLAKNVFLDVRRKIVSILLPGSKTDVMALTCTRSWGCLCATVGMWRCPFHAAVRQRELIESIADPVALEQDLPFYPQKSGEAPSKESVVASFEHWHALVGLPVLDSSGRRRMGGHSARLGGVQLLAQEGLHVVQIELMARWSSPMILHYAKSAPLTRITEDYEALRTRRELHQRLDELAKGLEALKRTPIGDDRHNQADVVQQAAMELPPAWRDLVNEKLDEFRKELIRRPSDYVRNSETGVWHVVREGGLNLVPVAWSACCGWPFGLAHFSRANVVPEFGRKCVKCFGVDAGDQSSSGS